MARQTFIFPSSSISKNSAGSIVCRQTINWSRDFPTFRHQQGRTTGAIFYAPGASNNLAIEVGFNRGRRSVSIPRINYARFMQEGRVFEAPFENSFGSFGNPWEWDIEEGGVNGEYFNAYTDFFNRLTADSEITILLDTGNPFKQVNPIYQSATLIGSTEAELIYTPKAIGLPVDFKNSFVFGETAPSIETDKRPFLYLTIPSTNLRETTFQSFPNPGRASIRIGTLNAPIALPLNFSTDGQTQVRFNYIIATLYTTVGGGRFIRRIENNFSNRSFNKAVYFKIKQGENESAEYPIEIASDRTSFLESDRGFFNKLSTSSPVEVILSQIGFDQNIDTNFETASIASTSFAPSLQKVYDVVATFNQGELIGRFSPSIGIVGAAPKPPTPIQEIGVFAEAPLTTDFPLTIKINKPNIRINLVGLMSSSFEGKIEIANKVIKTIEIRPVFKPAVSTSTFAPKIEQTRFIKTIPIAVRFQSGSLSSENSFELNEILSTTVRPVFDFATTRSSFSGSIEIVKNLKLIGIEPSFRASTIRGALDGFDAVSVIKPPPETNRFILRPIDLTIAGQNVIALWQPNSGSLLPVPQDLWASNQQLFLGFVRLGTSGTVQLRFRASQVAPSSGANDDISEDFENNGVIVFESSGRSVRLGIGGLDTTEPYGYRIVGRELNNLQTFLRSLPPNTNSIAMTLYARNPPIEIAPTFKSATASLSNNLNARRIGVYEIDADFNVATMANQLSIIRTTTDRTTRGNTIGQITPQPIVGWAATIEGIGLSRAYFRVWSGLGQLDLDGDVFEGTTFEGGSFASVSPVEHSVGSPSSRVNISVAVPSAAVRDMLNYDVGPVWIRVFNIISQDNGLSWTKLPTGISGRLSRPSFDVEGSVYTIEIETYSGDADRGRPLIWSAESQPGDKGFDFARSYESGVEIRWPP